MARAEFDGPIVDLDVVTNTGGVTLFVPQGVNVQILSVGSLKNGLGDDEPLPGAPLIRLRAKTHTGSVTLRRPKTRKRRWWGRRRG